MSRQDIGPSLKVSSLLLALLPSLIVPSSLVPVTDHHILTLSELDELVKKKGVTHVLNRHGEKMDLCLIRIKERIEKLAFGLDRAFVNIDLIIQKVVTGMYEGITTSHLDELSAETAAYLTLVHPDYSLLAARIAVSNLHKETCDSFKETITKLYEYIDNTGTHSFSHAHAHSLLQNIQIINTVHA